VKGKEGRERPVIYRITTKSKGKEREKKTNIQQK
jgi:hypothetical protein